MQRLDYLKETPSQTAGPYVHIGAMPNLLGMQGIYPEDPGRSPIREGARGAPIAITGTVRDGAGMILRDVLLESWQADADGIYPGSDPRGPADPNVSGWARMAADFETGEWRLETIRPGRAPAPDGRLMAPHIALWIVARGINTGLQTRICFEDEQEANSACPVLARIEQKHRIETLLTRRSGPGEHRFDIILQGDGETVFFDL